MSWGCYVQVQEGTQDFTRNSYSAKMMPDSVTKLLVAQGFRIYPVDAQT